MTVAESLKQEGIQAGIYLGRQEGRKEGIQLGKQEGIQLGEQRGMKKGRQEALLATALNLLHQGVTPEIVMKATGLTKEQLANLDQ